MTSSASSSVQQVERHEVHKHFAWPTTIANRCTTRVRRTHHTWQMNPSHEFNSGTDCLDYNHSPKHNQLQIDKAVVNQDSTHTIQVRYYPFRAARAVARNRCSAPPSPMTESYNLYMDLPLLSSNHMRQHITVQAFQSHKHIMNQKLQSSILKTPTIIA